MLNLKSILVVGIMVDYFISYAIILLPESLQSKVVDVTVNLLCEALVL